MRGEFGVIETRVPGIRVCDLLPRLAQHQDKFSILRSLNPKNGSHGVADAYLLTVPMWNFSIPYTLKYYIDCIVQPGYVFSFNEFGMPVPLVHDRKMICVTSRGSDYSPGSPSHPYDFQEPYLRAIFGFIGITDLTFVHVQAADMSTRRDASLERATAQVVGLAASPAWGQPPRAADAAVELSPVAS